MGKVDCFTVGNRTREKDILCVAEFKHGDVKAVIVDKGENTINDFFDFMRQENCSFTRQALQDNWSEKLKSPICQPGNYSGDFGVFVANEMVNVSACLCAAYGLLSKQEEQFSDEVAFGLGFSIASIVVFSGVGYCAYLQFKNRASSKVEKTESIKLIKDDNNQDKKIDCATGMNWILTQFGYGKAHQPNENATLNKNYGAI